MPIKFRCSECTQKLSIDDAFAGKRVACVRCGSKQRIPQSSSPEFAQPAAAPRESSPPVPQKRPPREQKSDRPAARRREPSAPEAPRRPPILFQAAQPETIESPPVGPEQTLREPIEPIPAVEELRIEIPVVSEPTVSNPIVSSQPAVEQPVFEPVVFEQPGSAQNLLETAGLEDVSFQRPQPVSRSRRVAAARGESSLVPPYKKLDVEEMIDMTAMVDIVFFLLIFFLVTSMHALDSTIPMPAPDPQKGAAREPKSVAAIDADDSYVVVRIDRNDRISVEGSDVRTDRDLLFKLRDLRLSSAHPEKLLVVGHGDATHGTVVMVLDTGRELGMEQVKLTVQDEAD